MPIHRVSQGECLSTIAARYGLSRWQALFDHPDNAELKKKRKNPNVLSPGDEIVVPERETKEVECATGKVHQFKVRVARVKVRVALQSHDGAPHAGARWVLELTGENDRIEGKTGDDGLVEAEVPLSIDRCVLSAWYAADAQETTDEELGLEEEKAADGARDVKDGNEDGSAAAGGEDGEPEPDVCCALLLGRLDPHDTISGAQARLRNLGFGGAVTGALDDATKGALRKFRAAQGLPADGELLDGAVAEKLRSLHDGEV